MTCPTCGKEMTAVEKTYRYLESGLDYVYLEGIPVFECPNGHKLPRIPKMKELLDVIADAVLRKSTPLTGDDVRFLRKRIGLRAVVFGQYLGVNASTISRWETGKEKIGPQSDRLIRLLYAIIQSHPRTSELLQEFTELRAKADRKKTRITITSKEGHYKAALV